MEKEKKDVFICGVIKNKIYLKANKKQSECMDEEYRV